MLYFILFVILLLLDQFTKYIVEQSFYLTESVSIIDGIFNLTYVENRGIAFGFFQGRLNIISVFTVLAILGILIYVFKNRKKLHWVERLAYTFILAGAIGNMFDRIFRGFVVDMLDFHGIWSFIFNLADVWINIGVIIILVDSIWFIKKEDRKEKERR